MNHIWFFLMVGSLIYALLSGSDLNTVTQSFFDQAQRAVEFGIRLIAVIAFWSGMLEILSRAGVTKVLARALTPFISMLFPAVPRGHTATGSIVMSMVANMLGLGNAATPLGIKAMEDLKTLEQGNTEASDAMCTFLAVTTSGLTIIPGMIIAMRAARGSASPSAILIPTLIASIVGTITAVVADIAFRRVRNPWRG